MSEVEHCLGLHGQRRVIHHQRSGAEIRTRLLVDGLLAPEPPGLTLDKAALFE